jgi:riboflavin kinase / FMN adenylyltransferase
MKLFDGLETVVPPFTASTVAIGTFDGIHVGHQAIIRTAVSDAAAHERPSLVFTFDRHPAELLAPDRAPAYLTTPQQRNRMVADLGVSGLIVAAFDHELANLTPGEFVDGILRARIGARTIVVGSNFVFGKNRAGDVAYLDAAQKEYGYKLVALDPVIVDGSPASSTRVRELLRGGEIAEAERVLGHPYRLAGTVVEGRKLGRKLGYPTANLALTCRQVVPQDGIYAVMALLDDGRTVHGACSIGERPTIADAGRSIETYLLDFREDIYGRTVEIQFVERLRGEQKFDSLEALTRQIAIDVEQVRSLLAGIA